MADEWCCAQCGKKLSECPGHQGSNEKHRAQPRTPEKK